LKRLLLLVLGLVIASPAAATFCSLIGAKDQTCTFASDTSGGTTLFTNPTNLSNIGSGSINPFLGDQVGGNGGIESGVNTDDPNVNTLPLNDKRDNNNTFTNTMSLSQLGIVTIGGVDYYSFFLDINEPNGNGQNLLSIDRLAIFGQTGATPGAAVDLNSSNITSLDDVDVFPNLTVVYRLGVGNDLQLDYNLFAGSGIGYDMQLLVPTVLFAPLVPDSRIVFAVQYGALSGNLAEDGFEEWAFRPAVARVVPEPATFALIGAALLGLAFVRRRRK
jgi:hypothetical protein